ncbi:aggregation-promoting factor C-terminal-like domain-containing protein, partial [Limosilactobacillus reuteri]
GDYSIANQEKVADQYVAQRYGSWEAALAFHNSHGWY